MPSPYPLPSFNCRVDCTHGFDAVRIRDDFPILARAVHGRRLVYLDNAATTQKPRHVIAALVEYYEQHNANVHRGIHALAESATSLYEQARTRVARFAGAEQAVFTRNATEALNLLAFAWARPRLGPGDVVLITGMEHHSNIVPWQMVTEATGATLRHVPVTDDGRLDRAAFEALLDPRVRVFALVHGSNVVGTINPVRELADAARAAAPGVRVFLDATQTASQYPLDLAALGCDALVFSAHKMYGPTGIGALAATHELLDETGPFLGGGEMIEHVSLERSTWAAPPHRFEAGTPNIADAVAFGATCDYLETIGMDAIREHSVCIAEYALERLRAIPTLRLLGPADAAARVGLVAFVDHDVHPHDLATILDRHGIAIRAGHHCAMPLSRRLGLAASARASFGIYNTREEVDRLAEAIVSAREYLGHVA